MTVNGVYGKAASGLQDSSWAANQNVARVGASGEKKSAALLDGFHLKAAVMHDLRVPIPGFKANIDHVIVSGKNVFILDTKVWKPGFYWTLAGTTRRGFEKVKHVDKDQSYLHRALTQYLNGTGAIVHTPVLVVWSSRAAETPSVWMVKVPGAKVTSGKSLVQMVKGFIGRKPADPAIVRRLSGLLVRAKAATPATAPPRWIGEDDPFL